MQTNKAAMLDEIIHFVTDLQTNLQVRRMTIAPASGSL
jgi:hypothetical protein